MVTIIEIKRIRSMCCIVLDSGEQFWIRQNELTGTRFSEGETYPYDTFIQNIRLCQYPYALNHAVSMLARRPCSSKEISSRLIRLRYTDEVAEMVVYKLKKENLVNDEEFCSQWIRFRLSQKTGTSLIRRELKVKGISEDIISTAFDLIENEEEQENAVLLAKKAWKRIRPGDDIRKSRQKIIAYLVRRGYDWETARISCKSAEQELK